MARCANRKTYTAINRKNILATYVICNAPSYCVNVFSVYRPTVFSESRACSATLFAVSLWKRARSRAENYSKQCKAKGFLKILLGVFIVFVNASLDILSNHIPDEPVFLPEMQVPDTWLTCCYSVNRTEYLIVRGIWSEYCGLTDNDRFFLNKNFCQPTVYSWIIMSYQKRMTEWQIFSWKKGSSSI